MKLEDVYQSKTSNLLGQLMVCEDKEGAELLMKELDIVLEKLEDTQFFVNTCLSVSCPDLQSVRKYLIGAQEVIQKSVNQDFDTMLMVQVSQALHRLDTFMFLSQNVQDIQIELWHQFSRSEMLVSCKKLLEMGNFEGALIVWNRHQSEFEIHPNDVLSVIRCIPKPNPEDTKSYNAFLCKFLPDCLHLTSHTSQVLEILSKWIIYTTKGLEAEKKNLWPQSGLEHAKTMLQALHAKSLTKGDCSKDLSNGRIPLLLQEHKLSKKSSLNKLERLIETLKDLKVVHEKYRLRVKLHEFDVEDKSLVANLLLDWCTLPEEVESLIKEFLIKFLKRFHYDSNEVLGQYVHGLIEETEFSWYRNTNDANDNAPWEETASIIIKGAISCVSTKLELILAALKQAPAPWSQTIQDLVQLGLKLNHPDVTLIKEQEKMVTVKQIVVKYQAGKSYNRRGMECESLLRRIFKVRQDDIALQDALKVAEVLPDVSKKDAYRLYVEKLIDIDEHKEALRIVRDVNPINDCLEIVEKMLIKAEIANFHVELPLVLFLKGASLLVDSMNLKNTFDERIANVKNRFTLKSTYNIETESDVQAYIKMSLEEEMPIEKLIPSLQKVADLLPSSTFEILFEQLTNELINLNSEDLVSNALEKFDFNLVSQDFILNLMSKLTKPELIPQVRHLSSFLSTNCDDTELSQAMKISSWNQYIEDLQDNSSTFVDSSDLDAIKYKMNSNYFKEKGLPIEDDLKLSQPLKLFKVHQGLKLNDRLSLDVNDVSRFDGTESFESNKEEDVEACVERLSEFCSALMAKNQTYLAFHVVKQFEWTLLTHPKLVDAIANIYSNLTPNILSKMLNEKKPDLNQALSLIAGQFSKPKAGLKVLSQIVAKIGGDNSRLCNLSRIGARYCSLEGLKNDKDQFTNLIINASWANKLGLKAQELASATGPEHLVILGDFIQKLDFPLPESIIADLEKYAKAFGPLAYNVVMQIFITKVLTSSHLAPKENDDKSWKCSEQIYQTTKKFLDQALSYVDDRDNFLINLLEKDVSPYNYEVIECILNRVEEMDQKSIQILEFLKNYQRVTAPEEEEIDKWLNSKTQQFPTTLAKQRLPFHSM